MLRTSLLLALCVSLPAQDSRPQSRPQQSKQQGQQQQGQQQQGDRQPLPEHQRPGYQSIDVASCTKWLAHLASDEMGGRETGYPGYKKAAEFIAAQFKEFGLKPVGKDGSYFQPVPYQRVQADPEKSYLALQTEAGEVILKLTPGQGLGGYLGENSDRQMELVDLVAETADDVFDADIRRKAVLLTDKSKGNAVLYAIMRNRPAAIIRINDDQAASNKGRVVYAGPGRRNPGGYRRRNTYAVSTKTAKAIRAALAKHKELRLATKIVTKKTDVFGANVVGFLEGRDPNLKTEIVGIGSHLDHIGKRGKVVNNGADDDGSGTTGVLAVARAFCKNGQRPRRSLLFMCFSGEEKGLLGSRHYVNNPIFPNSKMVAELQMDMIGRNEEKISRRTGKVTEKAADNVNTLHLVGSKKLSQDLHQICLAENDKHIGFEFEYDEENVFYRSDHANFARKDIPIAFFFTGFHPQYHQPDDTIDKINFPKLVRVAKLVYAIAFEVADREQPVKRDRTWAELIRSQPRRRRR